MLQAVDFGPACPQPVTYTGVTEGVRDMHEDCLYLNVYAPTVSVSHLVQCWFCVDESSFVFLIFCIQNGVYKINESIFVYSNEIVIVVVDLD